MRTITRFSIAGLLIGWATCAHAETEQTAEVIFEAPVESVKLDAQGNVTRVTFSNGAYLDAPQLDPADLEGLTVGGMRRLPFQVLKVDNPDNPAVPKLVVITDSVAREPVELPSDAGGVVRVYPGGVGSSYESGYQFICKPPKCSMGGQCVYCYTGVKAIGMPALIQTLDPATNEAKVEVLMSEIPVGKP